MSQSVHYAMCSLGCIVLMLWCVHVSGSSLRTTYTRCMQAGHPITIKRELEAFFYTHAEKAGIDTYDGALRYAPLPQTVWGKTVTHAHLLYAFPVSTYVWINTRYIHNPQALPHLLFTILHELGHCKQHAMLKMMHGVHTSQKRCVPYEHKVCFADAATSRNCQQPVMHPALVRMFGKGKDPQEVDADLSAIRMCDAPDLMYIWLRKGKLVERPRVSLSRRDMCLVLRSHSDALQRVSYDWYDI